jgi:hypothetical protein
MSHKRKRFVVRLLAVMTIFGATIFAVHAYCVDPGEEWRGEEGTGLARPRGGRFDPGWTTQ